MGIFGYLSLYATTFAINDSTLNTLLWITAVCLFFYGLIGEGLQRNNWGKAIVFMVVALMIGPGGYSIFN